MQTVAVARHAMATRFEIVLHGDDARMLRSAGEEALAEIDRLEAQLSLYRSTSEITRVNALAAKEPVRVSPGVFRLLQTAQRLSRETAGVFDITIAPLVRAWGFMDGVNQVPDPETLEKVRGQIGMDLVELNADDFTVRFNRPGMMLDLGAIGKGYALDRATELLREAGVNSALLHGGTSSIYGLGSSPEADGWKIALEYPRVVGSEIKPELIDTVTLRDESLAVSAVWGRSFEVDGKVFGHVIDPQSGQPVIGSQMAAVVLPSATETDAISTALLVAGEAGREEIANLRPGMHSWLLVEDLTNEKKYRAVRSKYPKVD